MTNYSSGACTWKTILTSSCPSNLISIKPTIEYWSLLEPFKSTDEFVGHLDSIVLDSKNNLYIRGWLFSITDSIQKLYLWLVDSWQPVLGYGLDRSDVFQHFSFIPQSRDCGFTFTIGNISLFNARDEKFSIAFKVIKDGAASAPVEGFFESQLIQLSGPENG